MIDAKKTWKIIAKYKTFGEADTARKVLSEEYEWVKVQKYSDHYGVKVWNPKSQKEPLLKEEEKIKSKKGQNNIRKKKSERKKNKGNKE